MSNTVKIKNRKKKKEIKVNYRLWAIVFGIFVAVIVALAVWASFHWGVGMGTIGVRPEEPENAELGLTDDAAQFATDGETIELTPEMLEQLQNGGPVEEDEDVQAEEAGGEDEGVHAEEASSGEAAAE